MKKVFLKKGDIKLSNGNYLTDQNDKPVYNVDFVREQVMADYTIKLVKEIKQHDFEGKKPENFANFISEFNKDYNSNVVKFVEEAKKPKSPTLDKLVKEATEFVNHQNEVEKTKLVNEYLQRFKEIKKFEDFGLYFEEEIVEIPYIYTLEEIIDAVKEGIEYLIKL